MELKAMSKTFEKGKWHTCKWYKQNFGVDPAKLNLPCKEVKNPYYAKAAPMKLWLENDVAPYKSEEGIAKFKERREAGVKAFKTRRTRLVEWLKKVKSENPRVREITRRLWEIGERINELHMEKEECRNSDANYHSEDFREYGLEHCPLCEEMSREQTKLREEREMLFAELEEICGRNKQIIQLARRYCREENDRQK